MKSLAALLALLALPAMAQTAEAPKFGDLKLHDFAAKWMVQQDDLAELNRYRDANKTVIASADARPRIVLMGDSIFFHWTDDKRPAAAALNVINRGIPGQNTTQMLLRFEDDVVALTPAAVVIFGGTNDLRAYVGEPAAMGPAMIERVARNVTAMADIAQGRGIQVVICAVAPVGTDLAKLGRDPATIVKLNAWLKSFAGSRGYPFVDYTAALADKDGHLPPDLSSDGLHPNDEAYRRMWPLLEAGLNQIKLDAPRR
ncbi:MAG: lipase [Rhodospirillales bacterium]|nr:lipase [Rhodospirillales bacterium]